MAGQYRSYSPSAYTSSSSPYSGYSNNNPTAQMLAKLQQICKKQELHKLIYLIQLSSNNYAESLQRFHIPQPYVSHNLNCTLLEKVHALKANNYRLITQILNLREVMRKEFLNRDSSQDGEYKKQMGKIMEKSCEMREKLAILRRMGGRPHRKAVNSQPRRNKEVINELSRLTELLQVESLKLKTGFSVMVEHFSTANFR